MVSIPTESYSLYGTACIRCNDNLIAPHCSRYVSERHISHLWSCERCGHQFERSDYLRLNPSKPFLLRLGVASGKITARFTSIPALFSGSAALSTVRA